MFNILSFFNDSINNGLHFKPFLFGLFVKRKKPFRFEIETASFQSN